MIGYEFEIHIGLIQKNQLIIEESKVLALFWKLNVKIWL